MCQQDMTISPHLHFTMTTQHHSKMTICNTESLSSPLANSSPSLLCLAALPSAAARACAGMEPLTVDDDICILKHETAYGVAGESPVSVCAGDESVASHFALVTAYEDIKKRLRDTERENTLLRKRVKQLEDKVWAPRRRWWWWWWWERGCRLHLSHETSQKGHFDFHGIHP